MLFEAQGDYAAARPLYEQALAIRKEVLGEHHPDYATSLNNLAVLLTSQGDYAAARPLYEQALAIRKEVLGERHPDYATSLNNLADAAPVAGGLRRRQAALRAGPGDPQGGAGRAPPRLRHQPEQPGGAARRQGDYAAAKPLYEQALAIRKEVLGERHPDYATSLNNLAAAARGAGGLRRRQAPLRAGPGDPQGGAGRAPPRLPPPA